MISARLVAYQPGTDTRLGILPDPSSASLSVTHNAVGALQVGYSSLARAGNLVTRGLHLGMDIAVEVERYGTWIEPLNCRFLVLERRMDPTDPHRMVSLTCPSYGWLLGKLANISLAGLQPANAERAGERRMFQKDAGSIMSIFMTEHAQRSAWPVPLGRDFSYSTDSAGTKFSTKATTFYPVGIALSAVLDSLVASGWCDWRTRGRLLSMWEPDTAWVDRSTSVRLDYGRELSDAPTEESLQEVVTRALVRGDGVSAVVSSPQAIRPWGEWEGFIEDSSTAVWAELVANSRKELAETSRVRAEYTRSLTGEGESLPFRDYNPGDWVSAPTVNGQMERVRVQQVTLNLEDGGRWAGSVVLNDRVLSAELRRAKGLAAVTMSTKPPLGGVHRPVVSVDRREPNAPTNFAVTPSLEPADSGWSVRVRATFTPPSAATDGSSVAVMGHELWGMSSGAERRLTMAPAGASSVDFGPLAPGSAWSFRMRAIAAGTMIPGLWTPWVAVTLPSDVTAPNVPSLPVLTPVMGGLSVAWDGLDAAGDPMPADFQHVEVHLSTMSGPPGPAAQPAAILSSRRGGAITPLNLAYDQLYFVHLVAVDTSGNRSGASAEASGTPRRLVAGDMLDELITENLIADFAVTRAKIGLAAISDAQIDSVTANKIRTGFLEAGVQVKAGDPLGYHAELSSTGFRAFRPPAEDEIGPQVVTSFGTSSADALALYGAGGELVAGITETGTGTFAGDVQVGGDLVVGGESLTDILAAQQRMIAYGTQNSDGAAITAETRYLEVQAMLQPDRMYEIRVEPLRYQLSDEAGIGAWRLRVAMNGLAVGLGSTITQDVVVGRTAGGYATSGASMRAMVSTRGAGQPMEIRYLLTYAMVAGAGTMKAFAGATLTITDVGPSLSDTGIDHTSGSVPATRRTYTSYWRCSGSFSYSGTNVLRTDEGNTVRQGYASAWGNQHGLLLFTGGAFWGEAGKTMAVALAGASNVKAELSVVVTQWYYSAGGTLVVYPHSLTVASNVTPSGVRTTKAMKGKSGRISTPVSGFTAAHRGVWVGKGVTTDRSYYGWIADHSYDAKNDVSTFVPVLKVTYTR